MSFCIEPKLIAGVFSVTVAVLSGVPARAEMPAKPDPADVEAGKRIYTGNCARCHGLNMVSTGAGFFDLRTFPLEDKPRFLNSVTNGLRVMPAWKEKLQPAEIEKLWAYVVSYQVK